MKLLFDVNVPRRLRAFLPSYSVATAQELGWARITNGELLSLAESHGFEAFVTSDQNIAYQQNLSFRKIALIVLSTNDWSVIKQSGDQIAQAVQAARSGSFHNVRIGGASK